MSQKEPAAGVNFQVHCARNVMVEMRDEVKLAADVHRPSRGGVPVEGTFPVLLHRTPYNKSAEVMALEAGFFHRPRLRHGRPRLPGPVRFRGRIYQVR